MTNMRRVSFAFLVFAMFTGLAALGVLLLLLMRQIPVAEAEVRSGLVRLAWICAALIALTFVLLAWTVMRHVRFPMGRRRSRPSPPHVDAWAVAGRRFKLDQTEAKPDAEEDGEASKP